MLPACPVCGHRSVGTFPQQSMRGNHVWSSCPKCHTDLAKAHVLESNGGAKRLPGEVSTFKQKPSSAMESASGRCDKGGPHAWRFGRCTKCGLGEGTAALQAQGGLEGLATLLKRWDRGETTKLVVVVDDGNVCQPIRPASAPDRSSSAHELSRGSLTREIGTGPSKCSGMRTRLSIKPKDIGLEQQGAAPLPGEQRRECHVCAHRWLDRHGRV